MDEKAGGSGGFGTISVVTEQDVYVVGIVGPAELGDSGQRSLTWSGVQSECTHPCDRGYPLRACAGLCPLLMATYRSSYRVFTLESPTTLLFHDLWTAEASPGWSFGLRADLEAPTTIQYGTFTAPSAVFPISVSDGRIPVGKPKGLMAGQRSNSGRNLSTLPDPLSKGIGWVPPASPSGRSCIFVLASLPLSPRSLTYMYLCPRA